MTEVVTTIFSHLLRATIVETIGQVFRLSPAFWLLLFVWSIKWIKFNDKASKKTASQARDQAEA